MGTSGFGTLQQTRAVVSWCALFISFDCLFEQCSSCMLYIVETCPLLYFCLV